MSLYMIDRYADIATEIVRNTYLDGRELLRRHGRGTLVGMCRAGYATVHAGRCELLLTLSGLELARVSDEERDSHQLVDDPRPWTPRRTPPQGCTPPDPLPAWTPRRADGHVRAQERP